MEIINKRYKILQELGRGNYGITYKVEDKINKEIYALKIVDLNFITRKKNFQLIEQFKFLSYINHPFIIKPILLEKLYLFDDYTFEQEAFFYIMPYIDNSYIIDNFIIQNKNNEKLIIETLFKIISSINFLHFFNISHNDIQKYNILIKKDNFDPVLLDLYPFNLEKELFNLDYKNLKNIIYSTGLKLEKVFNFLETFEKLNYNFSEFQKIYRKNLNERPELYFFNRNIIPDSSTFNLKKFYEKIYKDEYNFYLICYQDEFFLKYFSFNFYNFIKANQINTVYLNDISDLINFLNLKNYSDINFDNLHSYLADFILKNHLNLITTNFYNLTKETRSILYSIAKEILPKNKNLKVYIFSNKIELSLPYNIQKMKINISIQDAFNALSRMFNLIDVNIDKDFIINDPFHIYALYLSYCKSICENSSKKISKEKIYKYLFHIYNDKFKLDNLTLSQKFILYLFCISDTPLFLEEIFKIKYPLLNHFEIFFLLKNNAIIQNELKFFELYNEFLKKLFNKFFFSKDKSLFEKFGLFFLENNRTSPIKEKLYIELLYKQKLKNKLKTELINFYKKYPIFCWYDEFNYIYEYIFYLTPNSFKKDDLFFLLNSLYIFFRVYLNSKKLLKLLNWINLIKTNEDKIVSHFKTIIKLSIAFLEYNQKAYLKEYKNIDNEFLIKNKLSFFISELFYFSIHLNLKDKYTFYFNLLFKEKFIVYLNNIELSLLFFSLGHFINKLDLEYNLNNLLFLEISEICYNDAIEIKFYPLAAKIKHNIAYILEKIDRDKNIDRSIKYYEEAITLYEKYQMYGSLALTYNNLAVIYENVFKNSRKSLEYYEKSLYYARKSDSKDDSLLFILINLFIKYFETFDFKKHKKTLNEIEKILKKNKFSPYKLRYYIIYLDQELSLGNFEKADNLIYNGNKLIKINIYKEYIYDFIFTKAYYYIIKNEFKNFYKIFYDYFNKNIENIESVYLIDFLENNIIFSIIFGKKNIKLKKEIIDFIKERKINDQNNLNKLENLINIIESFNNKGLNQKLKDFFIDYIIEYDPHQFNLNYLLVLGIVGLIFKDDNYKYKFFNYIRIVYNKIPKKYKNSFLKNPPLLNLIKISGIEISDILSKEKLEEKIKIISKTKYDISNLIITNIFEPFIKEDNIDIIDKIKIILRYLIKWAKVTYASVYTIDNFYKINKIIEYQSNIFKIRNEGFSYSLFNQLISTGEPVSVMEIPENFKDPIFLALIPILSDNISQKRKTTSYYHLDNFRYYIHIESRFYINPFWNINKEVFYFISNLLSFASKFNEVLYENLYDPLTNIYLRNSFIKRVKLLLANIQKGSLFFIDIDNFKQINDVFGHNFGDKVLTEVSKIIKSSLRGNDIIGRYGGEEFLVFIPNLDFDAVKPIAERIRLNIYEANIIADRRISITIGISSYPDDGKILDLLIKKAELANRHGKKVGKNIFIKFSSNLEQDILESDNTYGIISRDPIKTQENIKILFKIFEIHNNFLDKFLLIKLQNKDGKIYFENLNKFIISIFEQIKKVIFFDLFIVLFNGKIISNIKNNNFIKEVTLHSKENYGFTKIFKRPYNYMKLEIKNLEIYIGNFKGFTYNDEFHSVLLNYINIIKNIFKYI